MKNFESIDNVEVLICLDTEWTCWEGSHELGWPNPKQPPETIQIGLAVYGLPTFSLIDTFDSFVAPKLNPQLSDYCLDLLPLIQSDVDQADNFVQVSERLVSFLSIYEPKKSLICSFGPDWEKLAEDAKRNLVFDPVREFPKIDVRLVLSQLFDIPYRGLTREVILDRLDLTQIARRHDALTDAHQLICLIQSARNMG